MIHDPVLINDWHPVASVTQLEDGQPLAVCLLGEELVTWQDGIFAQDLPILESQRPELLPLDLQAELHLRSDRLVIT